MLQGLSVQTMEACGQYYLGFVKNYLRFCLDSLDLDSFRQIFSNILYICKSVSIEGNNSFVLSV